MEEHQTLTVAGVVWRLLVVCECHLKHPHILLMRVCREWNCAPDDDGRKLLLHLIVNMGFDPHDLSVKETDCLWDELHKPTFWSRQHRAWLKPKTTGETTSPWSGVGKGTDPVAFLNRVRGNRLRRCSCAMREHLVLGAAQTSCL